MSATDLVAARNSRPLISALDLIFSPGFALTSSGAVEPPPIVVGRARAKSPQSPARPKTGRDQSTCSGRARPPEVQTPGQALTKRKDHQPSNKSPSGRTEGDFGPAAAAAAAGHRSKHATASLAKPEKDLPVAAFRNALRQEGFTCLAQSGRFLDHRNRNFHRSFLGLTDARGRLRRRDTLAALRAWRAEREVTLAAKTALQQQRLALAARLAPSAMPGCRADLTEAAAIAQLADDFLTRVAGFGSVEFKALIQMGWSAAQLREHGDAARALADRKAVPADRTLSLRPVNQRE